MQPGSASAAVGCPPHVQGKLALWPHLQQVCAVSIAIGTEAVDGLGQHIQAPRLVRAVLQGQDKGGGC